MKKGWGLAAAVTKAVLVMLAVSMIWPLFGLRSEAALQELDFSITAMKTSVALSWEELEGADSYYISRKVGSGSYVTLKSGLTQTVFTDTGLKTGTRYAYKVYAYKDGVKSAATSAKAVTLVSYTAPALKTLSVTTSGGKNIRAKITWTSTSGYEYFVLRKTGDAGFEPVASVQASSKSTSYVDKTMDASLEYVYTVCQGKSEQDGKIIYLGSYDTAGITTINTLPELTFTTNNQETVLDWTSAGSNISGYLVYRGLAEGTTKNIATLSSSARSYTDLYHNTFTDAEKDRFLINEYALDLSMNPLLYNVRAYKKTGTKISYGNWLIDGHCDLSEPFILGVREQGDTVEIEWNRICNAKSYTIYHGYTDADGTKVWKSVAKVSQEDTERITASIPMDKDYPLYSVRAVASMNGKNVNSSIDRGYDTSLRRFSSKQVLVMGDSVPFGTPYYDLTQFRAYSFPTRMQQLTACDLYDASLSGATVTWQKNTESSYRYRIVTDVAEYIAKGKKPNAPTGWVEDNSRSFEDFDVVLFAAGTNDYTKNVEIGSISDTSTDTFYGALNRIMGYIYRASNNRVQAGKAPIKVVLLDILYGEKYGSIAIRRNRYTTENAKGYTLGDYQTAMNKVNRKYKDMGLSIKRFDTSSYMNPSNCRYISPDSLHLNRNGNARMGNGMAVFLAKYIF
ncbi:MAG: SGNH/GDSL hydrolase family protein [Lachnospiraceae bacterium]